MPICLDRCFLRYPGFGFLHFCRSSPLMQSFVRYLVFRLLMMLLIDPSMSALHFIAIFFGILCLDFCFLGESVL